MEIPQALTTKYRPNTIAGFVGLDKPKRILQNFVVSPYAVAFLFTGKPGSGKTAMGMALANELNAELHIMTGDSFKLEETETLFQQSHSLFQSGKHWLVFQVDQADLLKKKDQMDLRYRLEGPGKTENVIWVFTADTSENLDEGLTSRCLPIHFSTQGISTEAAAFLEKVWLAESKDPSGPKPNFARIIKDSKNSLRVALNAIEFLH